jgi:hypothetical protein
VRASHSGADACGKLRSHKLPLWSAATLVSAGDPEAFLTSAAVRCAQTAVMSGRRPVVKGCFEAAVNVSGAVMSTAC